MALPDWAVIGGIVVTVVGSLIQGLRVKPESRKWRQDGTAAMMNSAGAMLTSVQKDMEDLRAELSTFRAWRNRVERNVRAHSRWDDAVARELAAAGITVPDPPPLFDTNE